MYAALGKISVGTKVQEEKDKHTTWRNLTFQVEQKSREIRKFRKINMCV